MRLAVANDWYNKKSAVFFNKDGFLRAIGILGEEWEVKFFKKHEQTFTMPHECGFDLQFQPNVKQAVLDWKPDAILFFCDFSRPILEEFKDVDIPKAQAFTGGPFRDHENVADIVFVESDSYFKDFQSRGLNVKRAFGVNTQLFRPMPQPKIFDAVFPATMAAWKRHELFAEAMGEKGLACGFWQPHEPHVIEALQKHGTATLHHQNAESTALIYNMGRTCLITSHTTGGSQRTVLEAMACNIPTIVMADSDKTSEYIRDCGVGGIVEPSVERIRDEVNKWKDKEVNTRDWVIKNYSEYVYAKQMKEGILSICK
jgi:glycosyltransferase involved in cell wall biosynthesis